MNLTNPDQTGADAVKVKNQSVAYPRAAIQLSTGCVTGTGL